MYALDNSHIKRAKQVKINHALSIIAKNLIRLQQNRTKALRILKNLKGATVKLLLKVKILHHQNVKTIFMFRIQKWSQDDDREKKGFFKRKNYLDLKSDE